MVRSLKADGAIALMDVQEQVSLPLHSHFIKKSLKMSQWGKNKNGQSHYVQKRIQGNKG